MARGIRRACQYSELGKEDFVTRKVTYTFSSGKLTQEETEQINMVRRARVPRDINNRIARFVPFNHRELSGWPDGIAYSPKQRRKRLKRRREAKRIDPSSLPPHAIQVIVVGERL